MIRGITFLWVVLAIMAGLSLYLLKHDVQTKEEELAHLHRQIERDRTAIHVLQAEWTYLNTPERLQALVKQFLPDMQPVASTQISELSMLPPRDMPTPQEGPTVIRPQAAPRGQPRQRSTPTSGKRQGFQSGFHRAGRNRARAQGMRRTV